MIEFDHLEKKFGNHQALFPLQFSIQSGEIFGFLGPNGSGKTTTFRLLMGLLIPTAGSARIHSLDCQRDSVAVKRIVGYLPDQPTFYDYLTGAELLIFVAQMHGFSSAEARERAKILLEEFSLQESAHDFAMNYSLGMKKKLALAMAMVHNPKVLLLDEPMNGLDPRASLELQDRLLAYRKAGGTVILSTHLLDVADKICTQIGIIFQGKMKVIDSLSALKAQNQDLAQAYLKVTES